MKKETMAKKLINYLDCYFDGYYLQGNGREVIEQNILRILKGADVNEDGLIIEYWYDQAANDFILHFEQDAYEVLKNIKYQYDLNPSFHMEEGLEFRNLLRELGYKDDKYGNLDNHYIVILNLCLKKVGLN